MRIVFFCKLQIRYIAVIDHRLATAVNQLRNIVAFESASPYVNFMAFGSNVDRIVSFNSYIVLQRIIEPDILRDRFIIGHHTDLVSILSACIYVSFVGMVIYVFAGLFIIVASIYTAGEDSVVVYGYFLVQRCSGS